MFRSGFSPGHPGRRNGPRRLPTAHFKTGCHCNVTEARPLARGLSGETPDEDQSPSPLPDVSEKREEVRIRWRWNHRLPSPHCDAARTTSPPGPVEPIPRGETVRMKGISPGIMCPFSQAVESGHRPNQTHGRMKQQSTCHFSRHSMIFIVPFRLRLESWRFPASITGGAPCP